AGLACQPSNRPGTLARRGVPRAWVRRRPCKGAIPAYAGMTTIRQGRGRQRRPRAGSSLHAGDVLAGAGVDADDLVLGHEQRHADHGAGLQGGRLAAGAGGVALHARVGLDDAQLDEVRRRDLDRVAVPQGDHAVLLALKPLGGVADAGLVGLDLLEGLLLHEVPVLAVVVQVLHVGIDDVRGLDRVGRLHGDFLHAAGADLAVLHAGEGLALARLDVLGVGDDRGLVVDQDLHPVLDVVHAVRGHGNSLGYGVAARRRPASWWRRLECAGAPPSRPGRPPDRT